MNEILLGLVQGITEFLPISSSGHVVFLEKLANFQSSSMSQLQISLHLGTLLSILLFFFKDYKKTLSNFNSNLFREILQISVGTIPIIILAFFLFEKIDKLLDDSEQAFLIASYAITFTGFFLFLTKFFVNDSNKKITIKKALIIGLAQCIAVIPGISRSGITISTALYLGVGAKDAFKFSFQLAIPAILGSSIIKLINILSLGTELNFPIVGFFTSFIVGYFSLWILILITKNQKLWYFSIYCFFLGIIMNIIF
jgi:undecaprenyl-diphosphatase